MATKRADNGRGARRRLRRRRPIRGRANPQGGEARPNKKTAAGRGLRRRRQPQRAPSRGIKAAAPARQDRKVDARQLALDRLGIQDGEQLKQFTAQTVGAIQDRDRRLGRPVYGVAGGGGGGGDPVAGGVPAQPSPYDRGPVISPEYQAAGGWQDNMDRQPKPAEVRGAVTVDQGVPQGAVPSPAPAAITREQMAANAAESGRVMLDPRTGAVVQQDPALARGAMPPEAAPQAGLTRVPPVAGVIGLDPRPPQPVDTDQQVVTNEQGVAVVQPIATNAVEQVAPAPAAQVQPVAAAPVSAPAVAAAPGVAAPVAATPQAAPVAAPGAPVASVPAAATPASPPAAGGQWRTPPGLRRRRLPQAPNA